MRLSELSIGMPQSRCDQTITVRISAHFHFYIHTALIASHWKNKMKEKNACSDNTFVRRTVSLWYILTLSVRCILFYLVIVCLRGVGCRHTHTLTTSKNVRTESATANNESASAASQALNLWHRRTKRMCAILRFTLTLLARDISTLFLHILFFLLQNAKRSFRVSVYLRNFSVFPFGICWRVQRLFCILLYYSIVVCPIHYGLGIRAQ